VRRRYRAVAVGAVLLAAVALLLANWDRLEAAWNGTSASTAHHLERLAKDGAFVVAPLAARPTEASATPVCGDDHVPLVSREYRPTGLSFDPGTVIGLFRNAWEQRGWSILQESTGAPTATSAIQAAKDMGGWTANLLVEASPGSVIVMGFQPGTHCRS
jgi:hypothetical protein